VSEHEDGIDPEAKAAFDRIFGEESKRVAKHAAISLDPKDVEATKKLTENPKGPAQLRVGMKDGQVVMDFGRAMSWLAVTPDVARAIASKLVEWATRADASALKIEMSPVLPFKPKGERQ